MRDHKADSHFIGHEPCPKCGSKDNLARYSDGHGYCFSTGCEYWESGEEEMQLQAPQVVHLEKMTAVYRGMRGISKETMEFYGCYTYLNSDGEEK